jgi:uncharacterized membrane protein YccC
LDPSPAAASAEARRAAVATALRSAVASVICLVVVAWLHLPNGGLAVYTAHVINLQYSQTPFQKGVERIVGRMAGVLGTTLLFVILRQAPLLCLAVAAVVLFALFYVQSSGRFAYGVMMATVFGIYTLATGLTSPDGSLTEVVWPTFVLLVIGVFAAEAVNFLTGSESTTHIEPGGQPMFPLRAAWLSRALRLTLTSFVAVIVPLWTGLPLLTTAVSAVILAVTPDSSAMGFKGWLRILAVILGSAYAFLCLIVLVHVQSFWLLAAMMFLGMFVGAFVGKAYPTYTYLGLQLGIVLGQVLAVPADEIADLPKALQRLVGAVVGVCIALVFIELWPRPKK